MNQMDVTMASSVATSVGNARAGKSALVDLREADSSAPRATDRAAAHLEHRRIRTRFFFTFFTFKYYLNNILIPILFIHFEGAGTALLGKEGAMACTVAVETAIGHHYDA